MRYVILLASLPAFAQTVTNIQVIPGKHSAWVTFDVTGAFNAMRIRYATSDTAGGAGGLVQNTYPQLATFRQYGNTMIIGGLPANTAYFLSPEVSNGGAFSTGISQPFTTLSAALPSLPTAPTPTVTTYTAPITTFNVQANCSDLQTQINAAVANGWQGDVIIPDGTVCDATGLTLPYSFPDPPDAIKLVNAIGTRITQFQTSDGQITAAGHGFTTNQSVVISSTAANSGCLPGTTVLAAANGFGYAGTNCDYSSGSDYQKGRRYLVNRIDVDHFSLKNADGTPAIPGWVPITVTTGTPGSITFFPTWQTPNGYNVINSAGFAAGIPLNMPIQFRAITGALPGGLSIDTTYYVLNPCAASGNAGCTTQLATTPSGAAIAISSIPTGITKIVDQGWGTMYIEPAPTANGSTIRIRSASALSLPATLKGTGSSYDSQMVHFRITTPCNKGPAGPAGSCGVNNVFQTGILSHNVRLMGIVFDTATNSDYLTTVDPRAYCGFFWTQQDSSYIIFDRSRIKGPGFPNRLGCGSASQLYGFNVGWIHSDMRGADFYHPLSTGFASTLQNSTQVTLAAGSAHGGAFITTTSSILTINQTTPVNGSVYAYVDMTGNFAVSAPTGSALNCNVTGFTCTVTTSATPGFPVDGTLGRRAGLQLTTITMTVGGGFTAVSDPPQTCCGPAAVQHAYENPSEGSNLILCGIGPGPRIFTDNYVEGAGIAVHCDDIGGPFIDRADDTFTNNDWITLPKYMALGPLSDGYEYRHRNILEWKGMKRIYVGFNRFVGGISDVSNAGINLAFTPRHSGGFTSDVKYEGNLFIGTGYGLPTPVGNTPTPIFRLLSKECSSGRSR